MNKTRIVELRQAQGWTQERLAIESTVGLRTIQRMEAGEDSSLETLSLVADALRVPVRDLFSTLDDTSLGSKVDSLEDRKQSQQMARDKTTGAWRWLFLGLGVIATLLSFTFPYGVVLFFGFWIGGSMIFVAFSRLYLDPRLDARYPLSRAKVRRPRRSKLADVKAVDTTQTTL